MVVVVSPPYRDRVSVILCKVARARGWILETRWKEGPKLANE